MDSTFTNQESVRKLSKVHTRHEIFFNKEATDDVDALLALFDLVDETENNDKIDSARTSALAPAPALTTDDDSQMIDELFNFDESNEAVRVAPVQENHETPSARFFTYGYFNFHNDNIASANDFRGRMSILGHSTDDQQMLDDLFNFDQNNEEIRIAPVHETPSSRLFTCGFYSFLTFHVSMLGDCLGYYFIFRVL